MSWRRLLTNRRTSTVTTDSVTTISTIEPDNRRLPVLADEDIHAIKFSRSGLITAIKNLQTLEATAEQQFAQGNHTRRRCRLNEQVHKNLCQHIAQQAHLHARLCYPFEHVDLVFDNIDWTEVPACRRAQRDCLAAIVALNITDHRLAHHSAVHPPVQELIDLWYSPAFNCTKVEFHARIYINHWISDDVPRTRRALF
jgi:hypothetical protein